MAIKLNGEFDVRRPPEEVFDFLTDPSKFCPLLPEFESVTVQDPQHFNVKVKVGVSYIKGTADVKMEITQAERPTRAQYKGQGNVAGGGATVIAGFDLSPSSSGTKVMWQGEAQVFGRLLSVAGGLLEPLGKKQMQKLIDGLRTALGPPVPIEASGEKPAVSHAVPTEVHEEKPATGEPVPTEAAGETPAACPTSS